MKKRTIKCVVSCMNSNGEPDFFIVQVNCTEEQIEYGAHYDAAKDNAAENGYEPYLVYDEDSNQVFISFFTEEEWQEAGTVYLEEGVVYV